MALHFQTCVRLTPDYWFASNAGPGEGPGSIDQAHTADEYVAVDQVEQAVTIYKEIIREF